MSEFAIRRRIIPASADGATTVIASVVTGAAADMVATGLGEGEYRLGPQPVTVRDGGARIAEGSIAEGSIAEGSIAGGLSTLPQGVARAVRESGVPLREAVHAATSTPASALGPTDVRDLRPGGFADLIAAGDDLKLRRVLRRGQWLS